MKNNYSAWRIDINEFSDKWSNKQKLLFFARFAILAPSGHNTQPWKISPKNDMLYIKQNPQRELTVSGKAAAEPYVSLGSFLETLRHAALGFGYNLVINYDFKSQNIIMVELGAKTTPRVNLPNAIVTRSSNRTPFMTKNVPQNITKYCIENSLQHVTAVVISNRDDIEFLAKQTSIATENIMRSKEFRKELSMWVRNNITKQHDGMPGFAQGMPMPPSLIARYVVKHINISGMQAKVDSQRVRDSGVIILLLVQETSPEAYFEVGRLYAQICIRATEKGYASSGVGASVIDANTRDDIVQKLKLIGMPGALVRLGKAKKTVRHTPRWPIESILD